MTRRSGEIGLATVSLGIPYAPISLSPTHPYARRAGGYGCRTCGRIKSDSVHRVKAKGGQWQGGTRLAGSGKCLECGTQIRPTSRRCVPCSRKRVATKWGRTDTIYAARMAAVRREEAK